MVRQRRMAPWVGLVVVAVVCGGIVSVFSDGTSSAPQPDRVSSPPPAMPTVMPEAEASPSGEREFLRPSVSRASPQPTPAPRASAFFENSAATAVDRALAVLDTIPIKGRAPKTGYDRELQFGSAWRDVDGNSCDTRNDILRRDLIDITLDEGCTVLRGTLIDPYTATTVDFVRGVGTSNAVQIDHVVALLNAWETGAQQLTPSERLRFANDPRNLIAVSGRANAQKGAGDAATWLPSNRAHWCFYVASQIEVKAAYRLWVTSSERDAMMRVLQQCAN